MLFFKKKNKENILIFGTGSGGVNFYKQFRGEYIVSGFLDNNENKHGARLFGHEIYSPEMISSLFFHKIYIASDYYADIHEQLTKKLEVPEERIEIFHSISLDKTSLRRRLENWLDIYLCAVICKGQSQLSKILFEYFYVKRHCGGESKLKLVNFDWLDTRIENQIHVFREEIEGVAVGPFYINKPQTIEKIIIPKVALYRFTDGYISSVSRSVLLPDNNLVIERVKTAEVNDADYSSSRLIYHGEKLAIIRTENSIHLDKGILINGGSETNYYHWMLEILSQLQFVDELPQKYDDYPIIISSSSQRISAVKSFIDKAGIYRDFIYIDSLSYYQVGDLLMITPPNNLVPNLKNISWSNVRNSYVRSESLHYLRKIASKDIKCMGGGIYKRVFLARKNFIRKYNQDALFTALSKFGFQSIYMEDFSFDEQVAIISKAEIIVGPTGAAWTNILFSSPGTKALCWMADEAGDLSCFSNIASALDIDLTYINYSAGSTDTRKIYYASYSIDIEIVVGWVTDTINMQKGKF
ncbi:MAG: glycosyltransferase family 61 protein [Aeromonas hydrophila]|uniref:glycosyltransferase family 61 protein n=2 Tax=Aeromonas hydrophila TaxID=644 RepID=UPI003D19C331